MTGAGWMTAQEAATYARMSLRSIYEAAEKRELSGVKTTPGSKRAPWRFKAADVDRWLERGREKAAS